METKLTLTIEKSVVEKANGIAKARKTSLSKLIENYLQQITNEMSDDEITPLVKSLSGIIKLDTATENKTTYADYLINKYD
jgi:hypothetical protein